MNRSVNSSLNGLFARAARFATLTALAATTALSIGLAPADAAPAALKPAAPSLSAALLRSGTAAVGEIIPLNIDFTWTDNATNEDGFELIARELRITDFVQVSSTLKTLPGELAGVGRTGRGTLENVKANTRYCFSVRAYQLKVIGDTNGDKSNEICLTTPFEARAKPTTPATVYVFRPSEQYIKWVQQALNTTIGAGIPVDGDFGPVTDQAVRDFQASVGIPVDGIVGPVTEKALVEAGASNPPGTHRSGVARLE